MSDKTVTISLRGLKDFAVGEVAFNGRSHRYGICLAFETAPDLKGQIPTWGDLWEACGDTDPPPPSPTQTE